MTDNVVEFPGTPRLPAGDDGPSATPPVDELLLALEALLFSAGEPVTATELAAALGDAIEPVVVRDALRELSVRTAERGVRVVDVAGGWQMRTDPRFSEPIMRLRGGRPQTMSRAALESLSVVAYRQPVTRQEIDDIRGVSSGGVVKTLLDKGYLRVVGRRDEPGRPLEYGTTPLFLELFELGGLDELPTLAERAELVVEQPTPEGTELPLAELAPMAGDPLPPDV